eukprot:XP_008179785.1 PREDICTED: uncharacterized protein LOC103308339 [Acyrthosiphon pisum]
MTADKVIKRVRHLEDLVMTAASAITQLNSDRKTTSSISLLRYIQSYGATTNHVNVLNDFIIDNLGGIQFMVNAQTNVLSRYRDINKIIEYIEIKNIEENIIEANGANINEIATNIISQNFSKKLGKKN